MRETLALLASFALLSGCLQPAFNGEPGEFVPRACASMDKCIRLEVVSTPAGLREGLMHRPGLEKNTGLLLVFPVEAKHAIWMKDMRFPIDILWLDSTGKIMALEENLPPCRQEPCEVFAPSTPARYALEVPAGYARENGLKTGKTIELSLLADQGTHAELPA